MTTTNPAIDGAGSPVAMPPDPITAERDRCRRVLAHHDALALARTAGACGSIVNFESNALRAAACDVAAGKDYPAA